MQNEIEVGRAPSGQALAVPVEPEGGLNPTGFDPSRECTCHPDDRPDGPCRKRFAASECRASFQREGLHKVRQGIRHHLMVGLIYRSTGRDPKNTGYCFAEVPDWQLRQWLEIVESAASGIAAGTDETLQAAQPEGREPGPQGDAKGTAMQNEQMLRLAERLEKATGPDRELDAEIWLAAAPGATRKQWSYEHKATGQLCNVDETRDASRKLIIVPAFTASIDAAMSLVENWPAELHIRANMTDAYLWPDGREHGIRGHAATPALALCAAALRSRTGDQSNG